MTQDISQTALAAEDLRSDFPILDRETRPGVRLVYLDSAASSQKPARVINAVSSFYEKHYANIHRGIHTLAEEATAEYEAARVAVSEFIGSENPRQIIFTRNTTESINLVAHSWGRSNLEPGDLVLLTEMEHHSNLVPWYMLAEEKGLRLEFIEVTEDGLLDMNSFARYLDQKPRLVAFAHMSNVLGTINPAVEMTRMAQAVGAVVVIDAAQSVPHLPTNVAEIGADFLAFSGHKMCGPSGVGVLYGRLNWLESMPPFLGGGDMIKRVRLREFTPNDVPHKFEAGTPAIAQVIGLKAAVEYLREIGLEAIHEHESTVVGYALQKLPEVPGVTVYGPAQDHRGGVASFKFEGVHAHDVAQILDQYGIAVRAGHHCAMPLHEKFELPATTRASFYLYNTLEEVDTLIEGLYRVKEAFD